MSKRARNKTPDEPRRRPTPAYRSVPDTQAPRETPAAVPALRSAGSSFRRRRAVRAALPLLVF